MLLRPATIADASAAMAAAFARGERVTGFDLDKMARVLAHTPEDMTVTTEAGITLGVLQERLRTRGQWLPMDPPGSERLTMGALLARNRSGPRRFGFGTIRDHLLGLTAVLADGRIVHSGGKVVKNVAGFDLLKLFVGSHGSLGVIVEATFKLLPLPEAECFVQTRCDSLATAAARLDAVLNSALTPVVLDLHGSIGGAANHCELRVVLGFSGAREAVQWQVEQAAALGFQEPATLDYEARFGNAAAAPPQRLSVLPSKVCATLETLGEVTFVARAGNGVIYYRGGAAPAKPSLPTPLHQRVKAMFDPKNILPDLPW